MLDLALRLTPRVSVGEGAIFGERMGLGGALAGAALLDAHAVLGIMIDPNITLIVGAGGGAGGSLVDGSSLGTAWVARVAGELGIEALMSRDTMLFAHVEGGWGFAPDRAGSVVTRSEGTVSDVETFLASVRALLDGGSVL